MKYEEAKALFENYVKDYDMNNPKVNHKYYHSYRVADYAYEIAKSLNLTDEEIELAHSCGLLHDIGRFYQVTKYDTYHDLDSVDHGDVGYDELVKLNVNNKVILKSTKYHNKRVIPSDLSGEEKLFLNITRDADKLDILSKTCLNVPKDELNLTDDIVELFKEKKLTVDKSENKSDAIQILRCVSFVFDINFDYSYKIIKDNNLILSKMDNLIKVNDDKRLLEIRDIVSNYIDERVKNIC